MNIGDVGNPESATPSQEQEPELESRIDALTEEVNNLIEKKKKLQDRKAKLIAKKRTDFYNFFEEGEKRLREYIKKVKVKAAEIRNSSSTDARESMSQQQQELTKDIDQDVQEMDQGEINSLRTDIKSYRKDVSFEEFQKQGGADEHKEQINTLLLDLGKRLKYVRKKLPEKEKERQEAVAEWIDRHESEDEDYSGLKELPAKDFSLIWEDVKKHAQE